MLKSTLVAAVFGLALIGPAYAENNKCDDVTMQKMMAEVEALTDASKKEMAMKEMEMAKTTMAANDATACGVHLDNAAKIYQ